MKNFFYNNSKIGWLISSMTITPLLGYFSKEPAAKEYWIFCFLVFWLTLVLYIRSGFKEVERVERVVVLPSTQRRIRFDRLEDPDIYIDGRYFDLAMSATTEDNRYVVTNTIRIDKPITHKEWNSTLILGDIWKQRNVWQ